MTTDDRIFMHDWAWTIRDADDGGHASAWEVTHGDVTARLYPRRDPEGRGTWMLDVRAFTGDGTSRMIGGTGYGAYTPQANDAYLLLADATEYVNHLITQHRAAAA